MPFIQVLGTAQDGGYPQAGCSEDCCKLPWENNNLVRYPSSIALISHSLKSYWIFDITPDIKYQLKLFPHNDYKLAGIFITHAHSGHYMGLVQLGLEVMNAQGIPVYVMTRMKDYLVNNSLFNHLIKSGNIFLQKLSINKNVCLPNNIEISTFEVPHRNELSETVGFRILGKSNSIIYLPDIDYWDGFEKGFMTMVENNDYLFIDGTFYDKSELRYRDISKVPHPTIKCTIDTFDFNFKNRKKIYFTHLNHTNKVLMKDSEAYRNVISKGFNILEEKQKFEI